MREAPTFLVMLDDSAASRPLIGFRLADFVARSCACAFRRACCACAVSARLSPLCSPVVLLLACARRSRLRLVLRRWKARCEERAPACGRFILTLPSPTVRCQRTRTAALARLAVAFSVLDLPLRLCKFAHSALRVNRRTCAARRRVGRLRMLLSRLCAQCICGAMRCTAAAARSLAPLPSSCLYRWYVLQTDQTSPFTFQAAVAPSRREYAPTRVHEHRHTVAFQACVGHCGLVVPVRLAALRCCDSASR